MKIAFDIDWIRSRSFAVLAGLGSVALSLLLAGCAEEVKPASDKLVIRGSNTVGEELAPRLEAEYKKDHPGAAFDHEYKGTSYGTGALIADACTIAAASRELTSNEVFMAKEHNVPLNDYVIGTYAVAVIVNAANPVGNLTTDQVRDIFTGVVKNWKELGGPDAPINLYIRDPISGTNLGFQELALERKPYALEVKTGKSYAEIAGNVAKDPNGIGYTSFSLTTNPGVRGVSIGGVAPTAAAVNLKQYPYARTLRLYTNKDKEPQAAVEFIHFIQSPKGQAIVVEMGFVPRS